MYDFKRIQVEDISQHLSYVAQSEGVVAEEEALHIIAQKSDGALRDALSTFDQIVSYSGDSITYRNVIENLNILDYEYYFKVTDNIISANISNLLLIFSEITENGFDGQHFITGLNEHLRNLLVIKDPDTMALLHASQTVKDRYQEQSVQFEVHFLLKSMEICNKFDLSYKTSNNKRLHVEIALMQLAQIGSTEISQQKEKTLTPKPKAIEEKKPIYNTPVAASLKTSAEIKREPAPEKQDSVVAPPATTKVPKKEIAPTDAIEKPVERKAQQDTQAKEEGNGRKIKNISIKASLDALKKKKVDNDEEDDVQAITTAFDQQKLTECWNQFTTAYQTKSPSFSHAIAKHLPILKDDFVI